MDFECNKFFNLLMNNQQEARTNYYLNTNSDSVFKIDDYSMQTNLDLNKLIVNMLNKDIINTDNKSDKNSSLGQTNTTNPSLDES